MVEQAKNKSKACFSRGSKRKSKEAGFPRRPLSAYNIFFKYQRYCIINGLQGTQDIEQVQDIVRVPSITVKKGEKKRIHRKSHGKIGFGDLAREISQSWKVCDASLKAYFQELSKRDKQRYDEEKIEYAVTQMNRNKLPRTHPALLAATCESNKQNSLSSRKPDIEPLPLASLPQQLSFDEDARNFILKALLRDE